ncbi:MAG TPA: T9SS type A sorting domain-containing protein, partial [Flavobacteriales bacterium]|nr:T9SS type A sorting domain-containing protein [Flavobacteriales bacterium]
GPSGDGIYGALIPAQSPAATVYYYIYAENNSAGMFSPVRAEYEFYSYIVEGVQLAAGDLVINEFMASNSSAVADQNGEFDDWIELYNNTSSDISLHNMFLSDDLTDPLDWRFPDTTIGANDFIIVWADNDAQTGLHASFKLSSLGEDVVLSNSDGSLLDSISFSQQITDLTTGRYPNGTGSFQTLFPTFGTVNSVLGINNLPDDLAGFAVYPNPASDILTVTFDNGALGYEGVMEIYNMLLQKINALPVQNDKAFTISTTNLSDGIYFLKLQGHVQKVVIAR